jgi:hypothetical protein
MQTKEIPHRDSTPIKITTRSYRPSLEKKSVWEVLWENKVTSYYNPINTVMELAVKKEAIIKALDVYEPKRFTGHPAIQIVAQAVNINIQFPENLDENKVVIYNNVAYYRGEHEPLIFEFSVMQMLKAYEPEIYQLLLPIYAYIQRQMCKSLCDLDAYYGEWVDMEEELLESNLYDEEDPDEVAENVREIKELKEACILYSKMIGSDIIKEIQKDMDDVDFNNITPQYFESKLKDCQGSNNLLWFVDFLDYGEKLFLPNNSVFKDYTEYNNRFLSAAEQDNDLWDDCTQVGSVFPFWDSESVASTLFETRMNQAMQSNQEKSDMLIPFELKHGEVEPDYLYELLHKVVDYGKESTKQFYRRNPEIQRVWDSICTGQNINRTQGY